MNEESIFRRRDLPHYDVVGKPSFVTACLAGSIPSAGLARIRECRRQLDAKLKPPGLTAADWEMKKHKLLFKYVDSLLDGEPSVNHLADERLANVVQNAFLHFADDRYQLFAFVVMPSHHHWVFLPNEAWVSGLNTPRSGSQHGRTPREVISHSIQSFTATKCNQILGRTGAFWQTETFDHFARNEEELMRIIKYVEQNPVVAGLVGDAAEYRWSSAHLRATHGIGMGVPIPRIVA